MGTKPTGNVPTHLDARHTFTRPMWAAADTASCQCSRLSSATSVPSSCSCAYIPHAVRVAAADKPSTRPQRNNSGCWPRCRGTRDSECQLDILVASTGCLVDHASAGQYYAHQLPLRSRVETAAVARLEAAAGCSPSCALQSQNRSREQRDSSNQRVRTWWIS